MNQPIKPPTLAELKAQIEHVEKSIQACKSAIASCKDIQEQYADKKLTDIDDLLNLKNELDKTATSALYQQFRGQ